MPTTSPAEHVYVYALIEGTLPSLPDVGMPEGGAPRAVPFADNASLILSTVPSAIYSAAAIEPRLSDLDWVSSEGAAHHRVVDALASTPAVVVPFRLLSIFSSEAAAVATVRRMLPAIRRAFDRVRGREEWVLRIGKPDPARRERAETPASAASGTSFLAGKAAARREAAERTERVKADAAASYDALRKLAQEATTRPVDPSGTLLLDAAFLVAPAQVEPLRQALTVAADRLLHDGCAISLTGPWPPYSFAAVDTSADG